MSFFLLWPLFARAPRHWFLENFLLSAPGVQSVFFFVALRWAPRPFGGARAKKNTTRVFFFCSGPGERQGKEKPRAGTGPEQKKKKPPRVFFFLLWPRAGTGLLLPLPFPGAGAKKNTLGGVFFFAAAPRGRSLTHCGLGWRCLPLAGVVFFFFAAAPPAPGWCFFFCCGPARTLTHSLWAGAISARPGWCFFFAAAPPGLFRQ